MKCTVENGYPENWKQLSQSMKQRDNHRCRHCGKKEGQLYRGRKRFVRVVLTCAHADHKLTDHSPSNLITLCAACHLRYDHNHSKEARHKTQMKFFFD